MYIQCILSISFSIYTYIYIYVLYHVIIHNMVGAVVKIRTDTELDVAASSAEAPAAG